MGWRAAPWDHLFTSCAHFQLLAESEGLGWVLRLCGAAGLSFGILTACTGVADVVTLALRTASPMAAESEGSTYAPSDSGDVTSEDWTWDEEEVQQGSGEDLGGDMGGDSGVDSGSGVGDSGALSHTGGTALA